MSSAGEPVSQSGAGIRLMAPLDDAVPPTMVANALSCLLIGGSAEMAAMLEARLKSSAPRAVEFRHTGDVEACIAELHRGFPNVIFLVPQAGGDAALDDLGRVTRVASVVPVVVLTESQTPDVAVRMVALGAQDVVDAAGLQRENLYRIAQYAIERHELRRALHVHLQELECTQQRFHSLIADNADAILIVDENGRVKFANPAAEALLRKPAHTMLNDRFHLPADSQDEPEIEIVRDDGSRVVVSMRFMRTLWDGRTAYIATLRDVSERKRAERSLEVAKRRAEDANRLKTQFLANMSHELRTPLNSILGFSELMDLGIHGDLGHDRYHDYIQNIRQSGTHLLSLINDLLDLSKVEAGKFELIESRFAIAESIESIVESLRPKLVEAQLDITVDVGAPDLRVIADQRQVKQILLNLLSNAIKFTPAGGSITVDCRLQETGELAISVADTGIGIPDSAFSKALAAFGQVDHAFSSNKGEGTGLGLTLCRRMAELHGGRLRLASKEGEGTTVTVTLPRRRVLGQELGQQERRQRRRMAAGAHA